MLHKLFDAKKDSSLPILFLGGPFSLPPAIFLHSPAGQVGPGWIDPWGAHFIQVIFRVYTCLHGRECFGLLVHHIAFISVPRIFSL
jgi:hypothetical protein